MCSTSENTSTDKESILSLCEQAPEEVVKANLFLVLAKAFSTPLEMKKEHADQLRTTVSHIANNLQEEGCALAQACEDALEDPEALSLAYARLFLGPFEILASPYASVYLDPEQRLMGPVSQAVAEEYATAGLAPGEGPNEVPDHVALEWEFLYYLTYQYVITGEAQWVEKRNTFWSNHMDKWIPSFSKTVLKSTDHGFYSALAQFTLDLFREPEFLGSANQ